MNRIKIYQKRDIGDTIKDTFAFAQFHAQPLWRWVLTIALPAMLVVSLVSVLSLKDSLTALQSLQDFSNPDDFEEVFRDLGEQMRGSFMDNIGLISLVSLVSMFVSAYLGTLVYNYLAFYKAGDEHNPEINAKALRDIPWYIGFRILLSFVLVLLLGLVAGLLAYLTVKISTGLGVFLIILAVLALIPLSVMLSMFFVVVFLENLGFMEGLKRCWEVSARGFLNTFLVLLIFGMMAWAASAMLGGVLGLVGGLFGDFGRILFNQLGSAAVGVATTVLSAIALTLNYGSIVHTTEGTTDFGDDSLIDQIGNQEVE